jgi:putative hemolysin
MIATFTKLLDIKIVASKRSESFFNSRILPSAACLFSSILPTSVGEREKNAISEAETKMIDDLLGDFQKNKVHIAIVVDEFGGTSGIVTMEDIIEEIVGEINDEYDEDERQYVRLNANTYVFEAKVLLTDFFRIMKLDDDFFEEVEGEADTLAGLLLEIKGEFPERHEVIKYKNYCFEVLEMDDRRILKIKVTVESPETSDEV